MKRAIKTITFIATFALYTIGVNPTIAINVIVCTLIVGVIGYVVINNDNY